MCTPLVPVSHASACVEYKDDLLVFFIVIIPGDQLALAGTCLPVDLPLAVTLAEFPELEELVSLAAALFSPDTDLAQPVVCCKQCVGADFRKVRVDTDSFRNACIAPLLPQPPGRDQLQLSPAEHCVTALGWRDTIINLDTGAGAELQGAWHPVAAEMCGIVIMDHEPHRIVLTVPELQAYMRGNAEWQVAGHLALRGGSWHSPASPQVIQSNAKYQRTSQIPGLCDRGVK